MKTVDLWTFVQPYFHTLQEMQISVLWLIGLVAFVVLVNLLSHTKRPSKDKGNDKMAREKRNAEWRLVCTALYDTIFDLWYKDKISDATFHKAQRRLGDDADLKDFKPYKRIKAINHLHPEAVTQKLSELKVKLKGKWERKNTGKTLDEPIQKTHDILAS